MTHSRKVPWSRGDKFLIGTLAVIFLAVLSVSLHLHEADQNPIVTLPHLPIPANNAHDYFQAAGDGLIGEDVLFDIFSPHPAGSGIRPFPPGQYPGSTNYHDYVYSIAEKAGLIRKNARAIQLIHRGFLYPYQEPPIDSTTKNSPGLVKAFALTRLLTLNAHLCAARNEWAGAATASLDTIQLGEMVFHGAGLSGMMQGTACQFQGQRFLWKTLEHLNISQAKAAGRRLADIRSTQMSYAQTLQEEEWRQEAYLSTLMQSKAWPTNVDIGYVTPLQAQLLPVVIRWTGKRTIMENYTHYMDQNIAIARQPYAAHRMPPAVPSDPVDQILLPVFAGVRFDEVEAHTQNALLLITLALQAYREDHAAFPATLRVLTPQYLRAVPDDPFALSGPMHYKRLGSRYLLYSVGPDGKDDGGKAIFDAALPAPTSPSDIDRRRIVEQDSLGDIVAGVNIP